MGKNINGRLSTGVSEFKRLITRNKIYVDKTRFIKKMLDQDSIYYFLSRPRRFGKTLFLTTLESFFKGRKELFKGLHIHDDHDEWIAYPVIRISMKEISNENPEILKKDLSILIKSIAEDNNIELIEDASHVTKFADLIKKLSKKDNNNIVVLIDEYDAPILSNLTNKKIVDGNRKVLQEFYNILKEKEEYLKFVFITGLSKFTKVSVFSTFNNLTDISLDKDYSTICGISESELKEHYKDHIRLLADENNYAYEEAVDKINYFYDGYSWDGTNNVFNPYSTLNALSQREFQSFWFTSGTPGFIAEMFKNRKITENYFEPVWIKASELDAVDPDNINESTLLFQSGYLTIKEANRDKRVYTLKIPNFEVEEAFRDNILKLYLSDIKDDFRINKEDMWSWIRNCEADKIAKKLKIKLSKIPYGLRLDKESSDKWKVSSIVFLSWLDEMGIIRVNSEKIISHGRIDTVLEENDEHVAIVEIKYSEDKNKSLDSLINDCFNQIYEKEYYLPYEDSDVSLIGLAFKDRPIKNGIITDVECKIEKWNY